MDLMSAKQSTSPSQNKMPHPLLCAYKPHICDDIFNKGKCDHEWCEIPHCPKHGKEVACAIYKSKGHTLCNECGEHYPIKGKCNSEQCKNERKEQEEKTLAALEKILNAFGGQ